MVYEKPTASNPYFDGTAERVYGFSTVVSGCAPINVRLGLLNSVGTQKNIAAVRPTGTAKKSAAVTPAISTPQLQQVNQVVAQQPVGPAAAAQSAPAPQLVAQQASVSVPTPTTSTPAKSEASYGDTMTWLKGKIESEGGFGFTSSSTFTDTGEVQTGTRVFQYAVMSTESCRMKWNTLTPTSGNAGRLQLDPSEVSFSVLMPNIKVQPLNNEIVGMPISESGKGWTLNITPRDPSYVMVALTKNIAFVFADADIAQRVANAFNHAIEVCGGKEKKELF
jgi:hypothetical protein